MGYVENTLIITENEQKHYNKISVFEAQWYLAL